MNSIMVNYDTMELVLTFEGFKHKFDLKKGDAGEFWHGFEHQDLIYDLNFFINDEGITGASVYDTIEDIDGVMICDTTNEVYIDSKEITENGNREKYLSYWWYNQLRDEVIKNSKK